uniref:Secreted protein n=1 Tax=Ixodes ricinus TaxID=34613 RepID=A0A0K8RMB0_IXORI
MWTPICLVHIAFCQVYLHTRCMSSVEIYYGRHRFVGQMKLYFGLDSVHCSCPVFPNRAREVLDTLIGESLCSEVYSGMSTTSLCLKREEDKTGAVKEDQDSACLDMMQNTPWCSAGRMHLLMQR